MKKFDSQFIYNGVVFPLEWHEVDDFSEVPREHASQIYGVCFYNDDIVLVTSDNKTFNLPGGTIEKGETYDETFKREIQEETNMRVVSSKPIGYQIVSKPDGTKTWQLRVAAKVEKIGDFESDPGGPVTAIKLCKIEEFNSYIQYGKVGERLIQRALDALRQNRL